MAYQSQPPQPTGDRWVDWATRLVTYLNRVRTQLQHKFEDESASSDGVLLFDPSEEHVVVSRNNAYEPLSYGHNSHMSAYTTATHSAASADTAYAITWENVSYSKHIDIDDTNTSRIVFEKEGIYQLDFSAELQSQNFLFKTIYIWPRLNGTDMAYSTIVHSLRNAGESHVVSRSAIFEVDAGDYIEAIFAVSNTNLWIEGTAATAFSPAAPSATIAVSQVDV